MIRKIIFGIILIFVIISCNYEIPEKVTIKGSPEFHLNLGLFDFGEMIGEELNTNEIKKMMGYEVSRMDLYNYAGYQNPDIQAYIIHYPITRMQLNLNGYVEEALLNENSDELYFKIDTIPPNIQNAAYVYFLGEEEIPFGLEEGLPFFRIDLSDMGKLIYEMTGTFGLKIGNNSLGNRIEVKIPAFGINDYITGTPDPANPSMLLYTNTGTIYPQDSVKGLQDGFLNIYLRSRGLEPGEISADIVFDWDTAVIDTSGKPFDGTFEIEFSLESIFGSKVSFKEVYSYIYTDGLGSNASLSLTDNYNHNYIKGSPELKDKKPPVLSDDFPENIASGYPHSLTQTEIDLKELFGTPGKSYLNYDITIPRKVINKNSVNEGDAITADFLVILVFDFRIDSDPEYSIFINGKEYFKLDLFDSIDDLFSDFDEPDGGADGGNGLFENIKYFKLTFENLKNDFLGGKSFICFMYYEDGIAQNKFMDMNEDSPFIEIDDLPSLSGIKLDFLIEGEDSGNYGEFFIYPFKDDPEFEFTLIIDVKTDININIP